MQIDALLLYVESEPRGTSPVPNAESLVFTPWKYAICPDRDLNSEPSDWRTCVLTLRPPRLSVISEQSLLNQSNCKNKLWKQIYDCPSSSVSVTDGDWPINPLKSKVTITQSWPKWSRWTLSTRQVKWLVAEPDPPSLLVHPVDYWFFQPHLPVYWVVEHFYWFWKKIHFWY